MDRINVVIRRAGGVRILKGKFVRRVSRCISCLVKSPSDGDGIGGLVW